MSSLGANCNRRSLEQCLFHAPEAAEHCEFQTRRRRYSGFERPKLQAAGRTILLNGRPLHLRGVSIHAEAPIHSGRVFSEADATTLLQWAKDLGCNFVRLPHYPHDEAMTRLADQMGLLVWSEIPVYWTIAWENPETLRNARQQLAEMISRDKNRSSVILWSVANETPQSET